MWVTPPAVAIYRYTLKIFEKFSVWAVRTLRIRMMESEIQGSNKLTQVYPEIVAMKVYLYARVWSINKSPFTSRNYRQRCQPNEHFHFQRIHNKNVHMWLKMYRRIMLVKYLQLKTLLSRPSCTTWSVHGLHSDVILVWDFKKVFMYSPHPIRR